MLEMTSAGLGLPGIAEHADRAGKVLDDGGPPAGSGCRWTSSPGWISAHPLPAGEHRIARVEHRRGPLPYLCLKNEVDDVAIRRQALADDDERPHAGVQTEL